MTLTAVILILACDPKSYYRSEHPGDSEPGSSWTALSSQPFSSGSWAGTTWCLTETFNQERSGSFLRVGEVMLRDF